MRKDITGIILSGGKSSRMQTNKALLTLGDKTVIEIILSEMKKVFDEVLVSANDCDDFSFLNILIIKDIEVNVVRWREYILHSKNPKLKKTLLLLVIFH